MRKHHAALKYLAMLVLLCTLSAVLGACADSGDKAEFYSGSTKLQLYGDTLYILKDTTLYARLLNNPEMGEVPVCSDSLCSHYDENCPLLFIDGRANIVIDKRESDENKNMPVIYYAYNDKYYDFKKNVLVDNGYAIKRYDAGTNVSTYIVKGNTEIINQIYMYGDTIYYQVNNSESGYHLEAVDKSGGNRRVLDFDGNISKVLYADDESVIFFGDKGEMYLTDPALSKCEFLMKTNAHDVYISGGYVYYPDDISVYDTIGGNEFEKCSVYRVPIMENTDAAPECVLKDVFYYFGSPIGVMDDKHFVFAKPEVALFGSGWKYDANGEVQNINVYAYNSGNIYAYNTEDGTVSQVIDIDGYDVLSYYTFTEDYAIIAASKLKEVDPNTPYVYEMVNTIAYSFADGSITILD